MISSPYFGAEKIVPMTEFEKQTKRLDAWEKDCFYYFTNSKEKVYITNKIIQNVKN